MMGKDTKMLIRSPLAPGTCLLGLSVLLLAGCVTSPQESAANSAQKSDFKACVVSDEGGFKDHSFNENSYAGVKAAVEELGIEMRQAESETTADFAPNVQSMVQSGCKTIITVGYALADATQEVAAANSDIHFAIVDDASIEADNVRPIVYDTAQAAFQAGYLAAAQTKTGKVATYGGAEQPTVTTFMDGFAQGVAYYNQEKGREVQVLGWDGKNQTASFTGDFKDQSQGKAKTQDFLEQGADIIMPVAGPVGIGSLEAVTEYNSAHSDTPASVIWVDADGYETNPDYQGIILTSVQKKMKEAVQKTITDDYQGKFSKEKYIGSLRNDGVGLAPFHEFEDKVSEETKTELADIKEKIISGAITVETDGRPTA